MNRYKCKKCETNWYSAVEKNIKPCQKCNGELIQMDSLDVENEKIREKENK